MHYSSQSTPDPVYGSTGPREALRQVADLVAQAIDVTIQCSHDGSSFESVGGRPSPVSVRGQLVDDKVIQARFEILRASAQARTTLLGFWAALASCGERVCLLSPEQDGSTREYVFGVQLRVLAAPMSVSRSSAFVGELKKLAGLARALQAGVPLPLCDAQLRKRYEGLDDYLEPVLPWPGEDVAVLGPAWAWTLASFDFLNGASSVALASPDPVATQFALSLLARVGQQHGRTLGAVKMTALGARELIELSRKAPGAVVVPAARLCLGSNRYDAEHEVQPLLNALADAGRPAVFTGSFEALQAVFHGGQGGRGDPLQPVVRHVPADLPFDVLARFAVRAAARPLGGLPQAAEDELTGETVDALRMVSLADRQRLLHAVAHRVVRVWESGLRTAVPSTSSFASGVRALSETFAGLSNSPRVARAPSVQRHFVACLVDAGLLHYLQAHLLGQDAALAALVARLRTESLTRPPHQPLRYAAQGTPGTGKSQSAVLLARRLSVPYINIDAASLPDHHTAASQLLGSGRGIVGSYQSGRLEQAAKHHTGAVLEVADLDHAAPSVRAALADLFLQVLETGEAQSAKGALFSCANLIIAFTMNLPEGRDEAVRRGVGFHTPSERAVRHRVAAEIRQLFSGAFLSRVGSPILFAPLGGAALAAILERSVAAAVRAAAAHLRVDLAGVVLGEGVGASLATSLQDGVLSSGARALAEHGRTLAAQAFLAFLDRGVPLAGRTLRVETDGAGSLILETQ